MIRVDWIIFILYFLGKNELTKLVTDKKKQFGPLVRWLKVNFSECFCAWIHVKALRVFVESVLRYGLPVNFQAILLRPHKKSQKRLRDVLNGLYAHLDSSATAGGSGSGNQDVSSNYQKIKDYTGKKYTICMVIIEFFSLSECGYSRLGFRSKRLFSICLL